MGDGREIDGKELKANPNTIDYTCRIQLQAQACGWAQGKSKIDWWDSIIPFHVSVDVRCLTYWGPCNPKKAGQPHPPPCCWNVHPLQVLSDVPLSPRQTLQYKGALPLCLQSLAFTWKKTTKLTSIALRSHSHMIWPQRHCRITTMICYWLTNAPITLNCELWIHSVLYLATHLKAMCLCNCHLCCLITWVSSLFSLANTCHLLVLLDPLDINMTVDFLLSTK